MYHICCQFDGHFGKCTILVAILVTILENEPFMLPFWWPSWNMYDFSCQFGGRLRICTILVASLVATLEYVQF